MRTSRFRFRIGFTLLELAVALGVIGVVAALLLPAVQAARESSRRVQCANNLRQFGLALHGYAEANGMFPAVNAPTMSLPTEPVISAHAYSPIARMLPHLGESALFDSINFSFTSTAAIALSYNHTVMLQSRAGFICPSDYADIVAGYGRVNYRFSLGPTPMTPPNPENPLTATGAFTSHRFYRLQDFKRGLSAVVGVSERIRGDWNEGALGKGDYRLTPTAAYSGSWDEADAVLNFCGQAVAESSFESRGGESWFLSGLHFTGYNHVATPNHPTVDCALDNTGIFDIHYRTLHSGSIGARSFHGAGVHALYMDGHLEFVADSVDVAVWRKASMRIDL